MDDYSVPNFANLDGDGNTDGYIGTLSRQISYREQTTL